jgi:hypothetical protein
MNGQPVRSFTRVAVAIVVAAIVISAAVLSYASLEATVTHTVLVPPGTSTSTPTITTTSTVTTTTTTTLTVGSGLYNVTFQQIGACSPPVYTVPWAVTLGNTTEARPPGTPIPIPGGGYTVGPETPYYYTIVFTNVPDGVYQYKITPTGPFYNTSGTVKVNGTDVSVPVDGPVVACTTTTA